MPLPIFLEEYRRSVCSNVQLERICIMGNIHRAASLVLTTICILTANFGTNFAAAQIFNPPRRLPPIQARQTLPASNIVLTAFAQQTPAAAPSFAQPDASPLPAPMPTVESNPAVQNAPTPSEINVSPADIDPVTTEPEINGTVVPGAMNLDDLIAMAMISNPTLVQASQSIEAARANCLQVGLWPNPTIGWEGEEIGNGGRAGRQGIAFAQPIITGGKLTLNKQVAARQLSAAQAALNSQRLRVANDVRIATYTYAAAQIRLAYQLELQRISEKSVETIQKLVDVNQVSQLDLIRAQVEAGRVQTATEEAQNDKRSAWRQLAIVIGRPDLQESPIDCPLEEGLPEFDQDQLEAELLSRSPQIAGAQARVEQAQCQLARERAERRPDIDVEGAVMYNTETEYTEVTIGVGMPLQIYNRNQGNICKAQAELIVAQREVDRLRLDLSQTLNEVYRDYRNSHHLVEEYRDKVLPNARKAMKLASIGYQQGEYQYLDLLAAQTTFFETALRYAQGLEKVWTATARLEGLLLTGGLDRPE